MKVVVFAFFILLISYSSKGQISDEKDKFSNLKVYKEENNKGKYHYAKNEVTSIKLIMSGMFLFYKNFFSSQDKSSCPFEISCSEYLIKSVSKRGVVVGILSGIDRYLRCNGHSNNRYKKNKKGKLIDPLILNHKH